MIFPCFDDLKDYHNAQNMPIEYLFDRKDILKKDKNNRGIKLVPEIIKRDFGTIKKEFVCEEDHLFKITGDKLAFAQNITPDLPSDSFKRFAQVFKGIMEIIEE